MIEQTVVFPTARHVISQIAPVELASFEVFQDYFSQQPDDWQLLDIDSGKADIGFDLGDSLTFLTPWVILAVREAVTLCREVILEVIKKRMDTGTLSNRAVELPLRRDEVPPLAIARLETEVAAFLNTRGIDDKSVRRISGATIQTLLFEPLIAAHLRELAANDDSHISKKDR